MINDYVLRGGKFAGLRLRDIPRLELWVAGNTSDIRSDKIAVAEAIGTRIWETRTSAPQESREELRAFGEVRSASEGRRIVGYPILFNSLSQDLGGFRELILPSAITFDDDVRADFNHDANQILGRVSAGTLKLTVDQRGVRMDANPPETSWANDLLVSIRRGDINQGSFAFRVLPGGERYEQRGGDQVRVLSKILVRKVSVVSDPAYTKTAIEARHRPPVMPTDRLPRVPPLSPAERLKLMNRSVALAERL